METDASRKHTHVIDRILTGWLPFISLVVEAVGFVLVVLDIYAPAQARQLEGVIARTSEFLNAWKREGRPVEGGLKDSVSLGTLVTGVWLILVYFRIAVLLAVWFMLWPLRLTLGGLDRLASGHALAGLGLVLAFLGLCFEIYELVF